MWGCYYLTGISPNNHFIIVSEDSTFSRQEWELRFKDSSKLSFKKTIGWGYQLHGVEIEGGILKYVEERWTRWDSLILNTIDVLPAKVRC